MNPIVYWTFFIDGLGLCNFTFMMWKFQIHSTPMNIKLFPEVFSAHGSTF